MSKGCLVDTTKCIGCRACQVACKQWNELPAEKTKCRGTGGGYENPPALSAKTHTRVTFHEVLDGEGNLDRSVFVKRQCMHCNDPSCVSACPVAALEKPKNSAGEPTGPVIYDATKCMGCRYCMMACPFNVPTLQWDRLAPHIQKCTFCFDRQTQPAASDSWVNDRPLSGDSGARFQQSQQTPACVKACPTGALLFGERADLLDVAWRRIGAEPDKYVRHVYGEKEVGGTAWMYVSDVPFEQLGLRTDLGETPYPEFTKLALGAVPAAVITVGAAMGGAYWIAQRRNQVAMAEKASQTHE
ncbi:MAG: 4Fe-4S dicluster domain-containing protein [Pirellulales bacterium]|nr:4Fe-4S dicluster domain-containing protein [Pirellulales bacterium]